METDTHSREVSKPGLWWSTPTLMIERRNGQVFNSDLARIILAEEKKITSKEKSTPVAGLYEGLSTHWRQYNVLNWDYPECKELRIMVLKGLCQFFSLVGDADDPGHEICGISAWANVLRHGDSLQIHHHDQAFVNGVYLVQTGHGSQPVPQHPDSGHTIYYRPGFSDRSHGERQGETINVWDLDWKISIAPVEGNLLFFPGYVRHEVRPHLGQSERISLAFEVYVKKQRPLVYFGGPQWFIPS